MEKLDMREPAATLRRDGDRQPTPAAGHSPLNKLATREASCVEELTAQNVKAVLALEEDARAHRTFSDRLADRVARFCGSITFFWTHVVWFGVWIGANLLPSMPHFDPFPFTFLTLVVSLEAIFLSTFILISQNHETKLAERRNHLDLQINLLAEQENTRMLKMLMAVGEAVGAKIDDDGETEVLEQETRPEDLAQQIDRAMEDSPRATEEAKVSSKK
jgi:uncharacterized membrane protein